MREARQAHKHSTYVGVNNKQVAALRAGRAPQFRVPITGERRARRRREEREGGEGVEGLRVGFIRRSSFTRVGAD